MKFDYLTRHPVAVLTTALVLVSLALTATGTPLERATQIAIYTLYGMGVNLLVAYTGLVPFGASVFFGTATYLVAVSLLRVLGNELLALAATVIVTTVLAALIGAVVLRRRGLYFSLLTLACSQIAFEIAFKWTDVTGGENGLQNVPRPTFPTTVGFHVFACVTVIAIACLLWRLVHAPFGRALQALRDNEQRAASLGYDTYRLKLRAFVISAAVIGYAGGLLCLMLQGAYANNLSWEHAGDSLLMTVLGGVHQFLGPLWGAIAFILLEDKLSSLTEHWWLIFAPIVIAFAFFSPEGIHGIAQRLLRRPRWTLVRDTIPVRPATIAPYRAGGVETDPATPVLSVRGLSKRFGSLVTAERIDLDVHPCRLHSFIGPNGAGKTTFFNMLTGVLSPTAGTITFDGKDVTKLAMFRRVRLGMSRSFQILSVFRNLTVFENVRVAVQAAQHDRLGLWRDAHTLGEQNEMTWSLLATVGLVERAAHGCESLSHGEQRLLEIALSLATRARLLLLDEPLAGLAEADRVRVAAIIRELANHHAVLLIEHDIDRVLTISDRVSVLHRGRLIADGSPAEVARHREVIEAYLGHAKGERPVDARLAARRGAQHEDAAPARRPLLRLEGVKAGYTGNTILDGIDLTLHEGEVIAILGRNGVGKTTTLRAATGVADVTAGRIVFDGHDITGRPAHEINRLGLAMVPEGRRLFPNLTVAENLRLAARKGGASVDEMFALFPRLATRKDARAEHLSGGERQMVAIARALMAPAKAILLDEPFEGLAPAVVQEVLDAVVKLRERASVVIVEHQADMVLPIADRAYVLVNGRVAHESSAVALEQDTATQAKLLGIVHDEAGSTQEMKTA
ncbi:branched-chain amino acid ABC transporter ATP-binding protein/permease [Burkholderia sp. Bp8990]|uniref:branched-chain amino acid ABC transporter ATP-binding protein/permease n=1 Tax=Burkholderia sp. Bp8990 TaxID=2184552 RepID=UPI000F5A3793|nr:branched-chain amino acid ABC transporter ATP-binding protein/permease [Burkholderia sp. Bp8990]RQS35142.1 ATP-binding cassette domain-containing protein [Burkholderia sp. Bp8990]